MSVRIERINELLLQEISGLLLREVKDPRLQAFITVTHVDTSADLKSAQVFVSILGSEEERVEALKGLSSASGFLRKELSTRLTLRYVPQLIFHFDSSIERGARLLEIMEKVRPK